MASETYDPSEQDEILDAFRDLMKSATRDGGKKRAAGTKPSWKIDPDHEAAIFSHLSKWKHGETQDKDSGSHPLVHMAWRALAIAWQETNAEIHAKGVVRLFTEAHAADLRADIMDRYR